MFTRSRNTECFGACVRLGSAHAAYIGAGRPGVPLASGLPPAAARRAVTPSNCRWADAVTVAWVTPPAPAVGYVR